MYPILGKEGLRIGPFKYFYFNILKSLQKETTFAMSKIKHFLLLEEKC